MMCKQGSTGPAPPITPLTHPNTRPNTNKHTQKKGFKLFTRSAVRVLFGTLHLERWGFDLEVVHLCDRLGLPMVVRDTHRGTLLFLFLLV